MSDAIDYRADDPVDEAIASIMRYADLAGRPRPTCHRIGVNGLDIGFGDFNPTRWHVIYPARLAAPKTARYALRYHGGHAELVLGEAST